MRRLCIDVGGTFTDCLVLDTTGELHQFKASTTPDDPTRGFFAAIGKAARSYGLETADFLATVDMIVHGTTLGTNLLVTGRGARVGMLTTAGFREVTEMRRGIKNLHGSMFDQFIAPYQPLVPRYRRLEVNERTLYTGEIATPLDEESVRTATRQLLDDGCEAIAICFLHNHVNPAHEQRARDIVQEMAPGLYVTTSHEVLPISGEFERFSTTVVSASIGPAVSQYLKKLQADLQAQRFGGSFFMMLANGLVQVIDHCLDRTVYLLGSGPAAAPAAALYMAGLHGHRNVLSLDMGGTSLDVCLVRDGVIPTTADGWVDEERVAIKMVDVVSIGAGGGSVAWAGPLGLLRVGPQSAGADPGPAAYGRGDEPTVTDADLVLGYIPKDYFLGGEMSLDVERSRAAIARVGEAFGMDTATAAQAIYTTVINNMANKITELCTKKGHDLRDFVLVMGGGAGGVHAAPLADRLGLSEVIVPRASAMMSAFGMFTMPLGMEFVRSRLYHQDALKVDDLQSLYTSMEAEAAAAFARLNLPATDLQYERTVEMRYMGQFHQVEVTLPGGSLAPDTIAQVKETFHQRYQELYTYQMSWQPVEFLTYRLRVSVPRPPITLAPLPAADTDVAAARRPARLCTFETGVIETPAYQWGQLQPGHTITGPAVIDDTTTSVLVPPGFTCTVDPYRNLALRRTAARVESAALAPAEAARDPITLGTVWHTFQTLCREMRHLITRTAQSFLMAQLKDVSVGVWLADGSMVAMPEGLMVQFVGTKFAIQAIREKFGDDLHPGDVILTNDPYHGGHNVHLPDWGFIRPIFYEGELLFFTLVRGHMQDTGGSYPGGYFPNAYDIHAEGLIIPPTKIFDRGQERTDVMDLILNNVRFREGMRVDCYSMIATTKFAEDRIQALLKRYGKEAVLACIQEMFARSEQSVRTEIAALPDGTYTGEAACDDDGTVLDEPVWVRADLTVRGDEMIIDFARSDKQRKGFVNSIYAATYGQSIGFVLLVFNPSLADYHNEGSLRAITIHAPPGTVTNAQYPATVGAAPVNVGNQINQAVLQAVAKARPDKAMAAWGKHRGCYTFAIDPRTGRPYVRTSFDYDGSAGAVWGHDGPTGPTGMGTLATVVRGNVEEAEVRFPWRILKLAVVPDFMGAGRWRGGGGVDWRAVNEGSEGRITTGSSDGDEMLAPGMAGGHPFPPSRTYLLRGDKLIRLKPHRMHDVQPGDILIKLSSGGGGVGDPRERPVEAVVRDVKNGYVSIEGARRLYGVALDPVTLAVDEAETRRLRSDPANTAYRVVVDEEGLKAKIVPAAPAP